MQDKQAEQEDEGTSEAAALEAASALAAVRALVNGLQAFLSPYLAALLQLLFSPQLLACKQAGCSEAAAGIRIQLAAAIPARLLLAPLFGYLDSAIKVDVSYAHALPCWPNFARHKNMPDTAYMQMKQRVHQCIRYRSSYYLHTACGACNGRNTWCAASVRTGS